MLKVLLTFSLALLTVGCANMIAPSGGLGDIIPPTLVSATPSHGATLVPVDSKIELNFSEWITPKSAKNAVMIFPPIDSGYAIDVTTKSIKISPHQPLKENQTYQLVLSQDVMDFANNGLKTSALVVFSTGTNIDSGKISGCIPTQFYSDSLLPKVALFKMSRLAATDSVLLGPVDYLTQTDRYGFFTFSAIQSSSYLCVGFLDSNRDNQITPSETVFIARKKTVETNGPAITLFPASSDTTRDHIVAVKIPSTNTLIATLSRPVATIPFSQIEVMELRDSVQDETLPAVPQKVITVLLDSVTLKITLPFQVDASKRYRLTTTARNLFTGTATTATYSDTLENRGNLTIDTVAPKTKKVSWNLQNPLRPLLIIQWDAPVTLQEGTAIIVVDSSLRHHTFPVISHNGNTTKAQANNDVVFNMSYSPLLPDSLARGYNGIYSLRDTTRYQFRVPLREDFTTELLLRFPDKEELPFPIISWEIVQKEVVYESKNGLFSLILPGYYTPKAFFDLTGDGTFSRGTLFPYKNGDVVYHFDDSIKSVARFSVEHALKPLAICEEPLPEVIDSTAVRPAK